MIARHFFIEAFILFSILYNSASATSSNEWKKKLDESKKHLSEWTEHYNHASSNYQRDSSKAHSNPTSPVSLDAISRRTLRDSASSDVSTFLRKTVAENVVDKCQREYERALNQEAQQQKNSSNSSSWKK